MENQNYDLAEEEFSKEGRIILWCVTGLFFTTGVFILFRTYILGNLDIQASFSVVPFLISLAVGIVAYYASTKRNNLYFIINEDKIEYRFGIIKPKMHLFKWTDIKELIIPSKQKKVKLMFLDGEAYVINLTWIEKKKAIHIIKHIYHAAREKNINIIKVKVLPD